MKKLASLFRSKNENKLRNSAANTRQTCCENTHRQINRLFISYALAPEVEQIHSVSYEEVAYIWMKNGQVLDFIFSMRCVEEIKHFCVLIQLHCFSFCRNTIENISQKLHFVCRSSYVIFSATYGYLPIHLLNVDLQLRSYFFPHLHRSELVSQNSSCHFHCQL